MHIESFTFDPVLAHSFVRLGYDLYRRDRHWIPPLHDELPDQLAPEFSFYRKAGNRHRHFIAKAGDKPLGRISAFVNGDLTDRDGTPAGAIGFFECVEDPAVARALLDAATGWLRAQWIRNIWGPMNFDIWHGYRFMTRGFGAQIFYGEPYNKPYYPAFWEQYGFRAKQCWHSVEITGEGALDEVAASAGPRYQKLLARGYRFEQFNPFAFCDEVHKLHAVLSASYNRFLGYTPISLVDFEQLFAAIRPALHPELFTFVYDEQNRLAGFAAAFLDLAGSIRSHQVTRQVKGGAADPSRLLASLPQCERVVFYLCGATPQEARRGPDFGKAVFHYLIRQILDHGYRSVLFALMAHCGAMARMVGLKIAAAQRQYTLYEMKL